MQCARYEAHLGADLLLREQAEPLHVLHSKVVNGQAQLCGNLLHETNEV